MSNRATSAAVTLFLAGVAVGVICGTSVGYRQGQKNPDTASIGLTEEQFPQLVTRCKNLWEAERIVDGILGVIKEQNKEP